MYSQYGECIFILFSYAFSDDSDVETIPPPVHVFSEQQISDEESQSFFMPPKSQVVYHSVYKQTVNTGPTTFDSANIYTDTLVVNRNKHATTAFK